MEEPENLAGAYELRDALALTVTAIQDQLTALNADEPGRNAPSEERRSWRKARKVLVEQRQNTVESLNDIKRWIRERENIRHVSDDSPSNLPSYQLHQLHITMKKLESLYYMVGKFVDDDSDENWQDLLMLYEELEKEGIV